jgi:hypothetical protein
MPRVILLVNVELEDGKRDDYLAATGELHGRLAGKGEIAYSVLENQGKEKNSFTEMFTFPSMDAYEAFDEGEDQEDTNEIFSRILTMTRNRPRYTTMVEVA